MGGEARSAAMPSASIIPPTHALERREPHVAEHAHDRRRGRGPSAPSIAPLMIVRRVLVDLVLRGGRVGSGDESAVTIAAVMLGSRVERAASRGAARRRRGRRARRRAAGVARGACAACRPGRRARRAAAGPSTSSGGRACRARPRPGRRRRASAPRRSRPRSRARSRPRAAGAGAPRSRRRAASAARRRRQRRGAARVRVHH